MGERNDATPTEQPGGGRWGVVSGAIAKHEATGTWKGPTGEAGFANRRNEADMKVEATRAIGLWHVHYLCHKY